MKKFLAILILAILAPCAISAQTVPIRPRGSKSAPPGPIVMTPIPAPVVTQIPEPAPPPEVIVATPAPTPEPTPTPEPPPPPRNQKPADVTLPPPPPPELTEGQKIGESIKLGFWYVVGVFKYLGLLIWNWIYYIVVILLVVFLIRLMKGNREMPTSIFYPVILVFIAVAFLYMGFAWDWKYFFGELLVVIIGVLMWLEIISWKRTPPRAVPSIVFFLAALGGFASTVEAQTTCTIKAITEGAVVVKEQDAAPITIVVENCVGVKSMAAARNTFGRFVKAPDVLFTKVVQQGNLVTAEVAATASARPGPSVLKLTLGNGTEVISDDDVTILVQNMDTGVERNERLTADARLEARMAALEDKWSSTPSKKEIDQRFFEVSEQAQGGALRIQNLEARVAGNTADVAAVAQTLGQVVDGVSTLAKEKRGGFLGIGKKQTNPRLAEAMTRAATNLAEARRRIEERLAAIRKQQGVK